MQRLVRIELVRAKYVPKTLEPGRLYVSEEYGAAVHLCACGCGSKVSTPLRPTEWALEDTLAGPTLMPSIGSWQLPCKSHYFIRKGEIIWSDMWTPKQVSAGRKTEESRRLAYYGVFERERNKPLRRLWTWINFH